MHEAQRITVQRHTTWTDDKCDNKPHCYSDDIENFEIIHGKLKR